MWIISRNAFQTSVFVGVALVLVKATKADDPVWKVIPKSAQAMTIVRDMESFSEKIDQTARWMGVEPPHVLDYAMSESKIREGLNLNGNLAWVVRPQKDSKGKPSFGTLYLLPATNFEKLIKPLDPRDDENGAKSVTVENREAFVALMKESAIFAFVQDLNALQQNLKLEKSIEDDLIPHSNWLSKQDIYLHFTTEGLTNGLGIELPLTKGSPYLKPLLERVQDFATSIHAETTDPQSLSLGIAIDKVRGFSVNGRLQTGPDAKVGQYFPDQPPRREDTLNLLRDDEIILAIGGHLSPVYNNAINEALQEGLKSASVNAELTPEEQKQWDEHRVKLKLNVERFQFGAFFPELPPMDPPEPKIAKPAKKGKEVVPPKEDNSSTYGALLRSLVLVMTVQDSKKFLTELEDWATETRVIWKNVIADAPEAGFFNLTQTEIAGVTCLQSEKVISPEVPKDWFQIILAAADDKTLIITLGGIDELKASLVPFQVDRKNLTTRESVHNLLQVLPESSAWAGVFDVAKLSIVTSLFQPQIGGFSNFIENDSLVVIGAAWNKPMLEITVTPSFGMLKTVGKLGIAFGIFRTAVSGPTPKSNAIKKANP